MTNEAQLIKIIDYLKTRQIANRQDIAKYINVEWHSGKMLAMLSSLENDGLITKVKTNVYSISSKGEKFESFEKLEENELWQIRLAQSNIEANELQKQMAIKNEIKEMSNRRLMRISIAVGIVSIISIVVQVVIAIWQAK